MQLTLDEMTRMVCEFIKDPFSDEFDTIAIKVFSFQFSNNGLYQNYCIQEGKTPETIRHWDQIPAVPTAAFKEFQMSCLPQGELPEAVFTTSGTTSEPYQIGKHLMARLSVYKAAILPNFRRHLLPDLDHPPRNIRMAILTAPPNLWPQSSLSHMMEVVRQEFGTPDSRYYISKEGIALDLLIHDLQKAQKEGCPILVLGISLGIYQLIEELNLREIRLHLPPGSRMMDTGGFKGHRILLSQEELYAQCQSVLGIPNDHVVNEYGMTEMSSQFYDNTLRNYFDHQSSPRYKNIPPWVRTQVLDPETLEPLPPQTPGLLKHLDLANCGSVISILTDDLGCAVDDGFILLGRIPSSDSRGCSLMIEDLRKLV